MKREVMFTTFVAWLLFSAAYAYFYVTSAVNWPDAEGYEKLWDWQLLFFAVARGPFLLVLLAVVLWVEARFVR